MSKKLIIGNWKMYKTITETTSYLQRFKSLISPADFARVNAVFCVPFTSIAVAAHMSGNGIFVGAQDMHYESEGPYTGEISAKMLKDAGAKYVLLGGSERFGTFDNIHLRVLKALEEGLNPVISLGETAQERDNFKTETVLKRQTAAALKGIPERYIKNIIIAYEPVWAVGTNRYASVAEASGGIMDIRSAVLSMYSGTAADEMQMIYGGSVNSANAGNLLATRNINGVIIGRNSLNPNDFYSIIKCVKM